MHLSPSINCTFSTVLSSTSPHPALFWVYKNMVGSLCTWRKKKIYLLTLNHLHSPSCLIQPFWKEPFTFTSTLSLDFSTPNLTSPQNEAIIGTAFNAAFLCPIPASCRNRSFKDHQWLSNYQTQWIFLSHESCWAYSHLPMLNRT